MVHCAPPKLLSPRGYSPAAVGAHCAAWLSLPGLDRAGWLTGKHSVISAEPATMCIVRKEEQAALQHLVGGGTDARYKVRRIEGHLSNFGERVSVITIQHDLPDSR